jgi:hypothetical protein
MDGFGMHLLKIKSASRSGGGDALLKQADEVVPSKKRTL